MPTSGVSSTGSPRTPPGCGARRARGWPRSSARSSAARRTSRRPGSRSRSARNAAFASRSGRSSTRARRHSGTAWPSCSTAAATSPGASRGATPRRRSPGRGMRPLLLAGRAPATLLLGLLYRPRRSGRERAPAATVPAAAWSGLATGASVIVRAQPSRGARVHQDGNAAAPADRRVGLLLVRQQRPSRSGARTTCRPSVRARQGLGARAVVVSRRAVARRAASPATVPAAAPRHGGTTSVHASSRSGAGPDFAAAIRRRVRRGEESSLAPRPAQVAFS